MAAVERDTEIIEQVLCKRARFYAAPDKYRTLMAFDRERGQFLLIDEGWDGYRRIHRVWAHVELREGKLLLRVCRMTALFSPFMNHRCEMLLNLPLRNLAIGTRTALRRSGSASEAAQ